jgi:SAM-dependent methyltransferase
MREEVQLIRDFWDEATSFHLRGNCYGLEDFKAGGCALHRIELEELGDVKGKELLHLQCHFGLDTLSWARRGAKVTGIDLSPEGVRAARALSQECGVPGEFVCSDLYDVRSALPKASAFDIVFTSYGVICWLPDLVRWAEIIAYYLKPGGVFYIAEAHPTARIFPTEIDMEKVGSFRPWLGYFHDPAGNRWPPEPDYGNPAETHTVGAHDWQHSLSDVVNALTGAGLVIEYLNEFPFCAWPVVAGCVLVEKGASAASGYYGLPAGRPSLPLMFSIRARKP